MSQILLSLPCRVHPVSDRRVRVAERAPQLLVVVLVRSHLFPPSFPAIALPISHVSSRYIMCVLLVLMPTYGEESYFGEPVKSRRQPHVGKRFR